MTLISTIQRVADAVGLPRPASTTSQDQLARQMLALANEVIEDLADMEWPVLQAEYQFPTVVNQEAYALPANFKEFIRETAYNASVYYNIRGGITPAEWQLNKQRLLQPTGRFKMRIMGDPPMMHIVPLPQVVENIVYEYKTNSLVRDESGTLKQLFTQDNDTARVPEEVVRKGIKWKIKHAKGLDYAEDYNDYQATKSTLLAKAMQLGSVPVSNRYYADIPELGEGYVPQTGYGS
jgi:hypothetical protein